LKSGQWGKKGRLERGSKMLGTINHLAGQVAEGRLEEGVISGHHYASFFQFSFPRPSWLVTMSTTSCVDLSSPHHNQLFPKQPDWSP